MTGSSHAAGRTGLSPPSSLPATHFPFPNSPNGSERPRPADSFAPLRPSPDIFWKARPDPKNRSAPARTSLPESLCPDRSARRPPAFRPAPGLFPEPSRTVPEFPELSRNSPAAPFPRRSPSGQVLPQTSSRPAPAHQPIQPSDKSRHLGDTLPLCPYPCRRLDTASGLSVPSVSEAFPRPPFQLCQSPESICAASSEARRPTCPAHFEASMPSLASFQRISRTARRVFLNFSSPATPILKAIFSSTA